MWFASHFYSRERRLLGNFKYGEIRRVESRVSKITGRTVLSFYGRSEGILLQIVSERDKLTEN